MLVRDSLGAGKPLNEIVTFLSMLENTGYETGNYCFDTLATSKDQMNKWWHYLQPLRHPTASNTKRLPEYLQELHPQEGKGVL